MAIRLRPRDPSKHQVGNAILYGGCRRTYDLPAPSVLSREQEVFYIETDFGNHMKLTWGEVMEMFTVAGWQDYGTWRAARAECLQQVPFNQVEEGWPDSDPANFRHMFSPPRNHE